ncbi:ANL_collapsed_G0027750.mRNA.1.CDS.1 [Saccharomyces cerevisiae]|nr:ANL_collapsed_G0027750.mRNA.1.CDS.1 [Saccharomyces cerevisiae]
MSTLRRLAGEADLTKLMLMPKSVALLRIRYTLEAALARGFTTVRDCGGAEGFLKAEIRQGILEWSQINYVWTCHFPNWWSWRSEIWCPTASAFDSCSCHFGQVGVVADGVPEC